MRRRTTSAGRRAAALHGDDGLALRDSPGDARELARVAERFQVEQHHLGGHVVLPELQEIVAAHVALVADRHELRHADPPPGGLAQQLDAQTSRLREERDVARHRQARRERGVEAHAVDGVDDTEAVRTDHAHAVAASGNNDRVLELVSGGTRLGETGGNDHQTSRVLARGLGHDVERLGGWSHDDHEVDRTGHVVERRVRRGPLDRLGRGVDRVDVALKAELTQVAHDCIADLAAMCARTHDRDRSGREQTRDRRRFRGVLARRDHSIRCRTRRDVEMRAHGAAVEAARATPSGACEHTQHAGVVGQCVRGERRHAVGPRDRREVLEEQRCDTTTLMLIRDDEGDLGDPHCHHVVTSGGHDVVAEQRNQRHVGDAVAVTHLERRRVRSRHRREEPEVQRLRAQAGEHLAERRLVSGSHLPNVQGGAVGQDDVGVPRLGGERHRAGGSSPRPDGLSRAANTAASVRRSIPSFASRFDT